MSRAWHPYENGRTVGRRGPEGGMVLGDEELTDDEAAEDDEGPVADARLTLEMVESGAYALSATLYGWMLHTHTPSDPSAAGPTFEAMKTDLARLADGLPYEGDRDIDAKVQALNAAIDAFTQRFA